MSKTPLCPFWKEECIEHACAFFMQLQGAHPQTGETISEFGCAIRWLVITQLENSKETRQAAAAIESFRNEMVKQSAIVLQMPLEKTLKEVGHGQA